MEIETYNYSKTRKHLRISLLILSLLQFALFYYPYYFYDKLNSDFLIVLSSYVINFFEQLLPLIAAVVISVTRKRGLLPKLTPSLLISLTRITYALPYFYVVLVNDVWDSIEALLIGLAISAAYMLGFFIQTFICVAIIGFFEKKSNSDERAMSKIFDFEDKTNFAIAMAAFFMLILFIVIELVRNTIPFIIDYKGSIKVEEILTMVLAYVLLIIYTVIHYALVCYLKNKIVERSMTE